ncbi:sugar transferase [bacterium]|nr:sugar transferase [bacterium]
MAPRNFSSKRFLDIILSAGILVFFSPILLFLAFAVKITSPGPIFFLGERIGRGGNPFRMIKFRTMVGDAEKLGPTVTAEGDPRVTRIGRLLRRTKLDELPTLSNVLRGEMSIVGPRPETAPWIALYTPEERRVLLLQPGITSLATVQYRHEEKLLSGKNIEEAYPPIMKDKLRIEQEYLRSRSFLADLRIITLTILALFQKHTPEPNGPLSQLPFSGNSKVSPTRAPKVRRHYE